MTIRSEPTGLSVTDYALGLLNEEAGEIVQEIGKGIRFGFNWLDTKYDSTAIERLRDEVADMKAAIRFAEETGTLVIDEARVDYKVSMHYRKTSVDKIP